MPTRALLSLAALTLLLAPATGCLPRPKIVIETPAHGTFTDAPSVLVTGRLANTTPAKVASVSVNGVPVALGPGLSFSTSVALDPADVIVPIVAELVTTAGKVLRDRATIVVGDGSTTRSVADGVLAPETLAMRINDTGSTGFS